MALELRAEKITFITALLLACVHAVLGWNWDSLAVLSGAIFFLLVGLKEAYLILTSVLPEQEQAETRIRRWRFALGWVLLMAGILLVAIWEMVNCAVDQWKEGLPLRPLFWPGLAVLGGTLLLQAGIFSMKIKSPGLRFLSHWMAFAPLVTLLSMAGFLPSVPAGARLAAVALIGLISLASLILMVKESLNHCFRCLRSALLLES